MSAKAIFELRNVPYAPIAQLGAGENVELEDWTGHRNAPVAVYEKEAPRAGWLDILNLAERLGSGPSLIPDDLAQRMQMIGLVNELIGENGLLWNARIIMLGLGGSDRAAEAAKVNPMYAQYGYSEQARSNAEDKARQILDYFTDHARLKKEADSSYLMGKSLSALDVYWAYFSQIFSTLPHEQCPMPTYLRKSYDLCGEALNGCDPILIEQRDWIFANHLTLPMEF